MKASRLRFETERLKSGPMTWEIDESPETIGLVDDPEYTFKDRVTGKFQLTAAGTTVLMIGTVKTIAGVECARCLEPIRIPLQASVTLTYMQDPRLRELDRYPELLDDDTHWFDGEAIYPAEHLRELLLLELPTVPACELEPDDTCPIRNVKVLPRVFGDPAADAPPAAPPKRDATGRKASEDPESWKDKIKKLRKEPEGE